MNLLLLFERDRIQASDGSSAEPTADPAADPTADPTGPSAYFEISGPRADHLHHVLGVRLGSQVRVGLLNGPQGTGIVERIENNRVLLRCAFEAEIGPRPLVHLCVAIPRPKSLKKLLPEVAALGIDHLYLFRAWKTEKPYLSTTLLEPEHHRPLLQQGLMQARSTQEPKVVIEPNFKPFVEDRLASIGRGRRMLLAHPLADTALADIRLEPHEPVVLVVGPEGGFIPYEVEKLQACGCQPVNLGPRILRVETACIALLAQLDLLRQICARNPRPRDQ